MTRSEPASESGTTGVIGAGAQMLRSSGGGLVAILVSAAVIAVVPLWIGDSRTLMGIAIRGLLFAGYAVAFNLIFGSTGQLFLCVGALAGVGGYGAVILGEQLGLHFLVSLTVAATVAAVLGASFSWVAVRRSLDVIFTGIVTLAFSLAFFNLLLGRRDLTGGETGLVVDAASGTLLAERVAPYFVFLALLVVYLLVYLLLHRSYIGWAFRALRDDEVAAELAGVDVARYRIYAGTIGSGMLGVSGALHAYVEGFISPSTYAFAHVDVAILVMLVLGGIGTLLGPVLGAAVFTVLDEVLSSFSQLRPILYGALLLVFFIGFPRGVIPSVTRGIRLLDPRRAGGG